ncbi:MAG: insulinase family protein [Holosporaceae bacterium]|jgi:secreted Zn-dependent insulinase-like peptidase|nr:insulinase family protein [Holosporaceae bacterium]
MKHKKLKIITSIAVIALISIPIFLRNEKQSLEVVDVSNNMGIKTSLAYINSEDVIYIRCRFKTAGVRCNSVGKHGISVVASRMLFDKIHGLSRLETSEKLADLGVCAFARSADGEDFCFDFYVTKDTIADALKFLSYAFSDTNFSSSYLEHIKKIYPNILDVETSSPHDLLLSRLWSMLYSNSTYGMNDTGSSQSISSLSIRDIQAFVRNMLRRDNLEILFVGKISRSEINDYVQILFAGLPETTEQKKFHPETLKADLSPEIESVISRPSLRDVVCVATGVRIDELSDLEYAALNVIADCIFNARIGDFSQGLHEINIVHNGYYEIICGDMSNMLFISVCLDKKDLENYRKYLYEKFAEYSQTLNLEALGKVKDYFIKISRNGFKSLQDLDKKIEEASRPYDEITEEIFEKVVKKLFDPSRLRTVIIGDVSSSDAANVDRPEKVL